MCACACICVCVCVSSISVPVPVLSLAQLKMYKAEGGWIRCTSPAAADPEFEAVTEKEFGGNEKGKGV